MASISFSGSNHALQVGVSHGPINAEFYLPPERPETPPSPLSTVPFPRDPDFVSRNTLLNQIQEKSLVPGSRIALVGLGGVGKSQLAIEYSYQVRSDSPATWVFWVHASNETRFEESFRDIADQVKIPGRQDPKTSIFKLVENWLHDKKTQNWICILDNVDDDKLLCSVPVAGKGDLMKGPANASKKPLWEYVPRSGNGFVIITSRTKEVALNMVDHKDIIEVKPMERTEAQELLQRKLQLPEKSQENRQLVEELEFIPLAIIQAASYIGVRAPRYSVTQYLQDFQKSDRGAIRLLSNEAGHLYRDREARNAIRVTWQISFDYIRQKHSSAADLLSLMSFFDWEEIPESLLRIRLESNPKSSSKSSDRSSWDEEASESDMDHDFEDDITILRGYSLISISKSSSSFTMHRLVQLITRAWLKSSGHIDLWREKYIYILYRDFPIGEYENWGKCQSLFPHVRSAMSQQPKSETSLLQWATLLYRAAWYASESGNTADLTSMAFESRKQRVKLLGDGSEEAAASTAMLAEAYSLEGRWEKAEQLQVQAIETYKTKLSADHPHTLTTMANLASMYNNQGQWDKAEQLLIQVIETLKIKLSTEHRDTLGSMVSLASTYLSQEREDKAEQLLLQVVDISKKKLITNHPLALTAMANLASTYLKQSRYDEAEQLHLQVVEMSKKKLITDHPLTLTAMANLASTYLEQGRCDEAEKLLMKVIDTSKSKYGPENSDTLASMTKLASIYAHQHRYKEAEQLEMQVTETRKMKLGADNPETLTSMTNLASTYWNQGRWKEAEELLVQVMKTCKTKLGEGHPNTLTTMANLAFTWKSSGYDAQAIDLLRNCLAKQKQNLGLDHPHTLSTSQILLTWETNNL